MYSCGFNGCMIIVLRVVLFLFSYHSHNDMQQLVLDVVECYGFFLSSFDKPVIT